MGVSRQQAAANRQAIIDGAERLFRARGVAATGLNDLMKAAGFTQGGFYNHFKSKDALIVAVVETAVSRTCDELFRALDQPISADRKLAEQIELYLSPAHRDDVERGCAIASFLPDLPRLSRPAQEAFASGFEMMIHKLADTLASAHPGTSLSIRRPQALGLYVRLVGAVVQSRALVGARADLADQILDTTRTELLSTLAPGTAADRR